MEFWEAKFARNRARDARDNVLLVSGGWTVITIWECRLKKGRFDATMRELVREIRRAEELRAQGLRSGRLVEIGSAASAIDAAAAGDRRAGGRSGVTPGRHVTPR